MQPYRALVASLMNEEVQLAIQEQTIDDLPEGDVLIQVAYSSVNYKDALAVRAASRVVKSYPIVPGIDLRAPLPLPAIPASRRGIRCLSRDMNSASLTTAVTANTPVCPGTGSFPSPAA